MYLNITRKPVRHFDMGVRPSPTILTLGIANALAQYCNLTPGGVAGPPQEQTDPPKPTYAIPSVATLLAETGDRRKVVTTFAGAGGSSTGYRIAGMKPVWASEFHPHAADCYESNWPDTIVDRSDIRDVSGQSILDAIRLSVGELDLFDGSPPCQPFSTMGSREKGWGKTTDHADGAINRGGSENLLDEWSRLVGELQPKTAVMENVPGLAFGKARGFLSAVVDQTKAHGYRVRVMVLDASRLGAATARRRLILLAVRNDLNVDPPVIAPLPYRYTMADACPWLYGAGEDAPWPEGHPNRMAPAPRFVRATNPGGSGRGIMLGEVRRWQGFPDDYCFVDDAPLVDQWARIGNSVAPPMAASIGRAMCDLLDRGGS